MITLIDAHVHVHAARSAAELLHAAAANFAVASDSLGHPEWTGVLMLAEMKEAAWFEDTRETGGWEGGGWTVVPDAEDDLLLRARGDGRELLIVAGRQLASREGIELLTLATRARLPDQLPLEEALQRAEATGGLTVLPWGAGKWLGRRGNWMREALQRQRPAVWAGDSGGRPGFWPAVRDFDPALARGRALISGTDPLPIPGDARRVGSFGCWLAEGPPANRPGEWLRERLRGASPRELKGYGPSMSATGFVRAQLALRLARRSTAASAQATEPGLTNPDEAPDVETSSAGYARRFAGDAGRYLLAVQSRAVAQALQGLTPGRALDVGGGHGQLVNVLRDLGWEVTVHGTDQACAHNLREVHGHHDCPIILGDLFNLPVADRSFDLVIAVRLVSHVEQWPLLVAEMCRVSSRAVVIDYPSTVGLNALAPLLFGVKKHLEGNTRNYISFSPAQLKQAFAAQGFTASRQVKQFFLPVVVHRMGGAAAPLRLFERLFRTVGLTAVAGSPVLLRMDRE